MSTLTRSLLKDQDELLDGVEHIRLAAREIPRLSPEERDQLRGRIVEFLRESLVPHVRVEERDLYTEIAELLGHPGATAPMIYDHLAIREQIAALEHAPAADADRLQELLYGLYTLIRTHFWKERELYFPLVGA